VQIGRRQFITWSVAAAAALSLEYNPTNISRVMAAETDPPIIWLQGAGCSGCTVSTLNVTNPTTIDDVLLNKISMKYNSTLMTASGDRAMSSLTQSASLYNGQFILVIEGAVPTGASGNYCVIGDVDGVPLTMQQAVLKYGPMAKYVVAAGTCASFGGVSAAAPNNTGCSTVSTMLSGKTMNPVVNLPGCPVHPTVLIQTLLDIVLTGVPTLDSRKRPTKYYAKNVHDTCERREGGDATAIGQATGCFEHLGCMGVYCKNVCQTMKWNNGVAWCIGVNHPCIGCANPTFPTNPLLIPQ